ncbi:MAG: hypothetical protein IPL53_04915 [Ignavibacteria bacterium]|nr:hypothetical protein [Ignavibacteria bacterium]
MLKSKVIEILKSFTPDEMKRFGEFLNSKFHNKNKKAALLFELLAKHHPVYENENLTKENLFRIIFGKEKKVYLDASIRNLLSDLLILAENFLSQIAFEKDKFNMTEKALRELSERKLWGVFEKKLNSAEELFKSAEFEGETLYYKKHILEEIKSSNIQFADDLKMYKDDSLIKSTDYLAYFFLIKIFKIINYISFQKQYNIESTLNIAGQILSGIDMEKFLEYVKTVSLKDHDILIVYYKMYNALANPFDNEKYFEFKTALLDLDSLFAPLEKYGLYVCLSNSCVQKIDNGDENFFKECFEVYELMFAKKIFDEHPGYLPMTAYTAFLISGLAAGEFDKIEKFVHQYSARLNPDHKEDALNYAKSQLYFYKKEYGKALECISKTDTEFSGFKYHLKVTSIKIYYETGDYDSLHYASDSFSHFINKNKIVLNLLIKLFFPE